MELNLNKWYLLNGSPTIKIKIIKLLKSEGWECFDIPPNVAPCCIRFTSGVKGKKLIWRFSYNERYMPKATPLDCNELLGQLEQIYNKQEENDMDVDVMSNNQNSILQLSYTKEMESLSKEYNEAIELVYKNNVYLEAIEKAINQVNKVTKLNVKLNGNWFSRDYLLLPSDRDTLRDLGIGQKEILDKLRDKYIVAQTLLDMADTYKEKKAILDKYTKNIL